MLRSRHDAARLSFDMKSRSGMAPVMADRNALVA
jgi:hypothetical protein